ncbi:type VI secretion system protein TssA [Nitrincola sp. MINF-07-Sa-05]|uniref:type VI secretion system protein TssA n=1 Tax=Nitrincola salilacus TaxID=3400273 RepID=UPI003917C6CA
MDMRVLQQPISDEMPQGEDLRTGNWAEEYQLLKDLRNALRNEERQALSIEDIYAGYTGWRPLFERATRLLEVGSKDIEVVAWMIEASIRLEGFPGLAQSLELLHQLLVRYWPDLYPKDEDGFESTLFPLTGLNGISSEGALIMPLRMAPLFPQGQSISLLDCIKAFEVSETKDPQKKEALKRKGLPDYELLRSQTAQLGNDVHRVAVNTLQRCLDSFVKIDAYLYEQCGLESPPSSLIKGLLQEALDRAIHLSGLTSVSDLSDAEVSAEPAMPIDSGSQSASFSGQPFNPDAYRPASRDEAFVLIRKLIVFFKETEPHSPIAYNLERINRWGDLSLPELIGELITDDSARANFNKITGVEVIKK